MIISEEAVEYFQRKNDKRGLKVIRNDENLDEFRG